jgi:predicted trehalose synthase
MAYTDEQIRDLDQFARAVIEAFSADDPHQLYAAHNTQAYQQYLAEVVSNLSGMRDDPRLFFESDLQMRKAWGDRIAADMARYNKALTESAVPTEVPDPMKAVNEQLATLKAEIEALKKDKPDVAAPPVEDSTSEA